jgi:hypothetical protein
LFVYTTIYIPVLFVYIYRFTTDFTGSESRLHTTNVNTNTTGITSKHENVQENRDKTTNVNDNIYVSSRQRAEAKYFRSISDISRKKIRATGSPIAAKSVHQNISDFSVTF